MKCPICKKKFESSKSKSKPFCSDRCKDIDLGNWLNEGYTIPAVELDDEEVTALERAIQEKYESGD